MFTLSGAEGLRMTERKTFIRPVFSFLSFFGHAKKERINKQRSSIEIAWDVGRPFSRWTLGSK